MTGAKPASFISNLVALAERAARYAVYAGGALMIASILLIVCDVITRKLFGWSTGGSDEISGYVFAISTSWSLAFTTLHRVHVRVDLLYQHLPARLSALLDWLSLVALGVFMTWLTFHAYGIVAGSIEQNSHANTPLGTPLALPQGLWFAGLVFMCLIMGLLLVRASAALVIGDIAAIKSLAGIRTAQEEADEEVAAGERLIEGERG